MRDKTRINEKAHQLICLTTEFCEQHLGDEYEQLCEFSTERNKKDDPFDKLMMINGLIVPIDIRESESQEEQEEDEDNTMQDKRQLTMDNFI